MNSEPVNTEEMRYPDPGVDSKAIADAVKEHVISSFSGPRRIDIWSEGGVPDTFHKQIGFTIWYTSRPMRLEAIAAGENTALENLLRDECIKRGFPETMRDRIYVWTDSFQALSRLVGQESEFNTWAAKVDPEAMNKPTE